MNTYTWYYIGLSSSWKRHREKKLEGRSDENGRLWERDDLTLAATAWCVLTRPVVGIVDRLEELFIVAAVRHASVEIARPLPFGSPYRVDMRAKQVSHVNQSRI